jgi:hypothetical protein
VSGFSREHAEKAIDQALVALVHERRHNRVHPAGAS